MILCLPIRNKQSYILLQNNNFIFFQNEKKKPFQIKEKKGISTDRSWMTSLLSSSSFSSGMSPSKSLSFSETEALSILESSCCFPDSDFGFLLLNIFKNCTFFSLCFPLFVARERASERLRVNSAVQYVCVRAGQSRNSTAGGKYLVPPVKPCLAMLHFVISFPSFFN